jgi:mannose-6-phosphate isomerase-like protein (cupin superfamily)
LMSLRVGEEIGNEVHHGHDQFFRIEKGKLKFIVHNKQSFIVGKDDAVVIPAGTWHNIINIGKVPAKLYTIYAPPTHPAGTVDKTKADAIRRGD